jgi:hypothetical protein
VGGIEVTCTRADMTRVAAILAKEADGRRLKAELVRNFRAAAEPTVAAIRTGARSGAGGSGGQGESLTAAIADAVRLEVRLGPKTAGVKIRAKTTPNVRKFRMAARRWNAPGGWRHMVYGRSSTWVQQVGNPNYFDEPPKRDRPKFAAAAKAVLQEMAIRIAARTRGV